MNITDYFNPVDFSAFYPGGSSPERYLAGPAVERVTQSFIDGRLLHPDAVIIGVPYDQGERQAPGRQVPDAVRSHLYRLAPVDRRLRIADLGNLKPPTSAKGLFLALRDVIESLQQQNIAAVVLGGSQELSLGIAEAFKSQVKQLTSENRKYKKTLNTIKKQLFETRMMTLKGDLAVKLFNHFNLNKKQKIKIIERFDSAYT